MFQIFVISWLNCCFYLERCLSIYITKFFFRGNFCFLVSMHDCRSVFSYIKFLSFTSNFHYSEQFKLHIQTIYNVEIIFLFFFCKDFRKCFFSNKNAFWISSFAAWKVIIIIHITSPNQAGLCLQKIYPGFHVMLMVCSYTD